MCDTAGIMWINDTKRRKSSTRGAATLKVMLALTLFAASCSSGSSDPQETSEAVVSIESDEVESVDSDEPVAEQTSFKPLVDVSSITDPVDDDLVFACNSLVASASDLASTFAAEPVLAALVTDRMSDFLDGLSFEGDSTNWAELETGWLIDRDPLTSAPQSFAVLSPGGTMFPCAFRRAGFFQDRVVAWQLAEEGSISIEACIDPATVVVDRRQIEGLEVVTLFAPSVAIDEVTAEEPECHVDGSRILELDGSDLVSGFSFPYVAPDPQAFQLLAPSRKVAVLPEATGEGLQCWVAGVAGAVEVTWTPLPAGYSAAIVSGDQVLTIVTARRFEESGTTQDAWLERQASYGIESAAAPEPALYRDALAPSESKRPYTLLGPAEAEHSFSLDCGDAGAQNFGGGEESVGDVVPGDLRSAASAFKAAAIGPYAYFTATMICDGCSTSPVELQMLPGGDYGHEFEPSLEEQSGSDSVSILNPFAIYELLSKAEQDGKDVSYVVDPLNGVVISYTIDGVGAELSCFEVDTAPPNLREGVSCNPGWDLLSSN